MTTPHAPRPGDLVALVSFDGDVYANQAVTRDRLGRTTSTPHPLAAAIERWLGRRPMWIDVAGRQVRGIATARELASKATWEIDTLVDACPDGGEVIAGLLRQATAAASEAGVTRVLLRLAADTPTVEAARGAGFVPVLAERLWTRASRAMVAASTGSAAPVQVREAEEADAYFEFQLYGAALPFEARRALGMTFEEWQAALDRRWAKGGRVLLAFEDGRARASLRGTAAQATLIAEPGHDAAAAALLARAEEWLRPRTALLQPEGAACPAGVLRDHGFEPGPTYALLALRTLRPIREERRETLRARTVVPSGG